LGDVAAGLDQVAVARGAVGKRRALTALLGRADAAQAQCLMGLLGGELRCGLREGALEDALARMAQMSVAQVQRANMLLGDIGETALGCRHGTLDTVHMRLFHPLKCMLATAAHDAADAVRQMPDTFIAEDKYDGIRAQAHIGPVAGSPQHARGVVHAGMRVALFSRTQDDITQAFPDLVGPLAQLVAEAETSTGDGAEGQDAKVPRRGIAGLVLDAEIVAVRGDAIRPFSALQTRLGRKAPDAAVQTEVPVALVAFDLLYSDGAVYLDAPHTSRRAHMTALPWSAQVRLAPSPMLGDVESVQVTFTAARARNNEGLVLKDPQAPYRPGRRGRDWLKLKQPLATLDVVVTAAEVGHGRRSRWLSDYTFAVRTSVDDPTLLNVGKAYSGLTDVEIAELTAHFRAHAVASFAHGRVVQVQPNVVLEVTFDRVQVSPRHKSGYALRFPRIVRRRPDKPVDEIDTLAGVAALCEHEA
jgi:DNA ligase-1